jgi:general stress protein 26
MPNTIKFDEKESILKLKSLVNDVNICLFCTDLKDDDGATCRPMTALDVDAQGNLWFFSHVVSQKNRAIKADSKVQLFFAHPPKGDYIIVNGNAEIIMDMEKIAELWSPEQETWFKGGKTDPNISIIKVTPTTAYYWDTEGDRMVNIFKIEN